jgi:cytochrome c-type biogenesis protein CcmH
MTLWLVFTLMTAGAASAVLLPLRHVSAATGGSEKSIYRDQLAEVARDVKSGALDRFDAETTRVEIARRLLAAADDERDPPINVSLKSRRSVGLVTVVTLPLLSAAFYLPLGSPELPDLPLAARTGVPSAGQSLDSLVAQMEAHLEKNPVDGKGWTLLAPVLTRLGRYNDAVRAYRNSISYSGDSAQRRADLGEALIGGAGGVVTAEGKAEFEQASALNPSEAKAQYFLGLAAEQDGRMADAAAIWLAILANEKLEPSRRAWVRAALARAGGPTALALLDREKAPRKEIGQAERGIVIHNMVERLATRLNQDGGDVDGWLRLIRAYVVLGEREKARSALSSARQAVANDRERVGRLSAGLTELGVDD